MQRNGIRNVNRRGRGGTSLRAASAGSRSTSGSSTKSSRGAGKPNLGNLRARLTTATRKLSSSGGNRGNLRPSSRKGSTKSGKIQGQQKARPRSIQNRRATTNGSRSLSQKSTRPKSAPANIRRGSVKETKKDKRSLMSSMIKTGSHPFLHNQKAAVHKHTGGRKEASAMHKHLTTHRGRKPEHHKYTDAKGNVRMVGRDLAGLLTISDDSEQTDIIFEQIIAPDKLGFPALSIESLLHEQFYFTEMHFDTPDNASAFVNGDVLGFFNRDPSAPLPSGFSGLQAGYFKGGHIGVYKQGFEYKMPLFEDTPVLYVNAEGSDDRLTEQCTFQIMVVNPPTVYSSGGGGADAVQLPIEIWATYSCEFYVATIDNATLNQGPCTAWYRSQIADSKVDPLGCALPATGAGGIEYKSWQSRFKPVPGFFMATNATTSVLGVLANYGSDTVEFVQVDVTRGTYQIAIDYITPLAAGVHLATLRESSQGLANFVDTLAAHPSREFDRYLLQIDTPGYSENIQFSSIRVVDPGSSTGWKELSPTQMYPVNWYIAFSSSAANANPMFVSIACTSIASTGVAASSMYNKCGIATVEGQATQRWRDMTPKERAEFGSVDDFIKAIKRDKSPPKEKKILVEDIEDFAKWASQAQAIPEEKIPAPEVLFEPRPARRRVSIKVRENTVEPDAEIKINQRVDKVIAPRASLPPPNSPTSPGTVMLDSVSDLGLLSQAVQQLKESKKTSNKGTSS